MRAVSACSPYLMLDAVRLRSLVHEVWSGWIGGCSSETRGRAMCAHIYNLPHVLLDAVIPSWGFYPDVTVACLARLTLTCTLQFT